MGGSARPILFRIRQAQQRSCTMSRHIILNVACALALSVCALNSSLAQSNSSQADSAPVSASEDYWTEFAKAPTVLTIAPDGSWGTATDHSINTAITAAIANCKKMYQEKIGCGSQFTTILAGWSLVIRCGRENIIVAEKTLADAEQAALNRENELRRLYVPNMPPCMRVVTIDPHGAIITPQLAHQNARR
jgi:hypothetical protein